MDIKICGITNLADARYAAAAGATHLGFILYESSPRFVEEISAKEIIEWVSGPVSVGVFVNRDADEINRTAENAGFDMVQLHGDETPETCRAVEKPVFKAIRIQAGSGFEDVRSIMLPYTEAVDYFLLDAHSPVAFGGTGTLIDWELAAALAEQFPIFLSGGITPENAADALRLVRPEGVDISSGLEEEPGRKSFEKIDALFEVLGAAAQSDDSA